MGIGSIMKARKILVVVSGEDKADAIKSHHLRTYHSAGSSIHSAAAQ